MSVQCAPPILRVVKFIETNVRTPSHDGCPFFVAHGGQVMIPGAPENKAISPIHVAYKLGFRHAFLSCACGATLDLNKVANKTRAGQAFRAEHEECRARKET